MAGQNVERREVLRVLALASAAAQFPGFQRWAFACPEHPDHDLVQAPSAGPYRPQFFSSQEYPILEILTDLIIPSDGTPGAREAGVSEFIDFMVSSDPEIQYRFRYGIGWIDARARSLHGRPFAQLDRSQQTEMLEHLAYTKKFRPGEEDGRAFFKLIRDYSLMGFYTSRIGLQELDYPGLKTHYDQMPGCPHHDDREHKHLPSPQV